MNLLIGTHNKGKLREYRALLKDAPVTLLGLDEVGLGTVDVQEDQDTFLGNATKKALAYARASGLYALADDTGLCVDALDGAPGVHSARYGDPGLDDRGRRLRLLEALADVPERDRTANFTCVIVVANPADEDALIVAEGRLNGSIGLEERDGGAGFGYDAIFLPDGYGVSLAELPPEGKNHISHRGVAARHLLPKLAALV